MIFFETPRLIIRTWKPSDLTEFKLINSDHIVMKYFPNILSEKETNKLYYKIQQDFIVNEYSLYAIEVKASQEFIGFCGFNDVTFTADFTPCVEIGWRLKQAAWGKGFATEAAKGCLNYAKNKLSFRTIYSFTSIFNHRSENVMKKLQMKKIGEFYHPKLSKRNWLSKHVLYKLTW